MTPIHSPALAERIASAARAIARAGRGKGGANCLPSGGVSVQPAEVPPAVLARLDQAERAFKAHPALAHPLETGA